MSLVAIAPPLAVVAALFRNLVLCTETLPALSIAPPELLEQFWMTRLFSVRSPFFVTLNAPYWLAPSMMIDCPVPSMVIGELMSGNGRSEEHTSELQSRENLVCRLLLEKKKDKQKSR